LPDQRIAAKFTAPPSLITNHQSLTLVALPAAKLTLAIARLRDHNCHRDVGNLFRRSRRPLLKTIQIVEIMMHVLASSLLRWLTVAACISKRVYFRRNEAEFPATSQNACRLLERTVQGRRGAGCASPDALRLFNNSVNLKDHNEISFIREASASFTRRIQTKGRSKGAFSTSARESPEKDILAAIGSIFWKRRSRQEISASIA
jgi:hypothetical protein